MKNISKNKVNVLIAGPLVFPRPCATTSRVTAYAKGLLDSGSQVSILCARPVGGNDIPANGTAEGIDYIYSAGVTKYQSGRLRQIYYELKGFFISIYLICKLHRRQKIDAILFYAAHIYHEVIFSLLAKTLGIKVMRDLCEYPFYYDRSKSLKLRIKGYLYERLVFPLFDALIIMTHALEEYSKPFLRKSARYIMVPILVDVQRFEHIRSVEKSGKYIAYCGDPGGNKDGVDILIESFAKIAGKHPEVTLYIIGDTANRRDPDFLKRLQKTIDEKCGQGRVVLTGKVAYNKVPEYLCGACVLVLARPQSIQAKYGFPTKLGEYLATGNPVVVTDVGEISQFIVDGDNGFITKPGDVDAFAWKLDYVLSNPEHARQVGLKGKALASDKFDYRSHGLRLIEFITSLKNC